MLTSGRAWTAACVTMRRVSRGRRGSGLGRWRHRAGLLVVLAVAVVAALNPVATAAPAAFAVNSTGTAADARPGDGVCATTTGVCTLRAAIHESNVLAGADTVELPAGTYRISTPSGSSNDIGTGYTACSCLCTMEL